MKSCNHRKLPFAFAALAFCCYAPSVLAATDFTLNDTTFSHSQLVSIAGGLNLSDSFTFTLDMLNGGSTIDLSSVLSASLPAQIQFFDVTGTTPKTVGYNIPLVNLVGPFATTPFLNNGDYMGIVTAGILGVNVNLTLTATPVPEASEWGMMLAGIGLIGLQLRRRTA